MVSKLLPKSFLKLVYVLILCFRSVCASIDSSIILVLILVLRVIFMIFHVTHLTPFMLGLIDSMLGLVIVILSFKASACNNALFSLFEKHLIKVVCLLT